MDYWSSAENDSLYKFHSSCGMILPKLDVVYVHPSSVVISAASATVGMFPLYMTWRGSVKGHTAFEEKQACSDPVISALLSCRIIKDNIRQIKIEWIFMI